MRGPENNFAREGNASIEKSIEQNSTIPEKGREEKLSPQEKVFSVLKDEGIFEEKDERVIADIDAFKNPEIWKKNINKRIFANGAKFSPGVVFQLLGDMKIVPKNEYEKAQKEQRDSVEIPLFNIPVNF